MLRPEKIGLLKSKINLCLGFLYVIGSADCDRILFIILNILRFFILNVWL